MAEFTPNPASHVARDTMRRLGLAPRIGGMSRNPKETPRGPDFWKTLVHPLPHYLMWRGNTTKYRWNESFVSRWGEGDTKHRYHQYFAHAKDPKDYDKPGRDFELMQVREGKINVKPLPRPQYVAEGSRPVAWTFRSWADLLSTLDPWQREVHYAEHVPEHIGAKRPLCPLAPSTYHQHMHLAYMTDIKVTLCPYFFGYGGARSVQRSAIDFYRRCLSGRAMLPKDKVQLHYTVDPVAPRVEVTWLDGTTYSPPLLEGCTAQNIVQSIMEEAWMVRDRLEASGKNLQPLSIDDYRWNEVIQWKKQKKADSKAKK